VQMRATNPLAWAVLEAAHGSPTRTPSGSAHGHTHAHANSPIRTQSSGRVHARVFEEHEGGDVLFALRSTSSVWRESSFPGEVAPSELPQYVPGGAPTAHIPPVFSTVIPKEARKVVPKSLRNNEMFAMAPSVIPVTLSGEGTFGFGLAEIGLGEVGTDLGEMERVRKRRNYLKLKRELQSSTVQLPFEL